MWIQSLEQFIEESQDKREIQRARTPKAHANANTVKMLCAYKHEEIMPILGVSSGFISKWKLAFFKNGIEGLKLAHKASQKLLNTQQRSEFIEWLKTKDKLTLNQHSSVSWTYKTLIVFHLLSLNCKLRNYHWLKRVFSVATPWSKTFNYLGWCFLPPQSSKLKII